MDLRRSNFSQDWVRFHAWKWKLFGMPYISNRLEKNGLLPMRMVGSQNIIQQKKLLDLSGDWYKYMTRIFKYRTFTAHWSFGCEPVWLRSNRAVLGPGLCPPRLVQHSAVLCAQHSSRVRAGLCPLSSGHTPKHSGQSGFNKVGLALTKKRLSGYMGKEWTKACSS